MKNITKIITAIVLLIMLFIVDIVKAQNGNWVFTSKANLSSVSDFTSADSMNSMIAITDLSGNGAIMKSEDGCRSWKRVYLDSSKGKFLSVKSISYPSKNFAIAQFDSLYIVKSTNGGLTWDKYKFTNINPPYSLTGWNGIISMKDDKIGYLSTSNTAPDKLFKTIDGGTNWIEVNNKFLNGWDGCLIENLICLDKDKIICILDSWALNSYGIATSLNGGKNWVIITNDLFENKCHFTKFSFLDGVNGFLMGYYLDTLTKIEIPMLFKTNNGGLKWEEIKMNNKSILKKGGPSSIYFTDSLNGVMGAREEIISTIDGGSTWESEYYDRIKAANQGFKVTKVKGSHGLAITNLGNSFYYQPRTTKVKAEKNKGELILYPNPTSTTVKVRLQPGEEELTIRDVLGKEIKSYKGIGTITGTEEYEIDVT
ncbi:MAG: hypothetical protein WAT89_04875, partial [Candidatus Kapaibacterium sp.]